MSVSDFLLYVIKLAILCIVGLAVFIFLGMFFVMMILGNGEVPNENITEVPVYENRTLDFIDKGITYNGANYKKYFTVWLDSEKEFLVEIYDTDTKLYLDTPDTLKGDIVKYGLYYRLNTDNEEPIYIELKELKNEEGQTTEVVME